MRQFKKGVKSFKKREKTMAVGWDAQGTPFVKEKGQVRSGIHEVENDDVDDELDVDVAAPSQYTGQLKSMHFNQYNQTYYSFYITVL